MLRVHNVYFNYGEIPVLNGVSFHVREGELCGLFGPNGSGKTTLFRCCLRFLKLKQGTVQICGNDISKLSTGEMAKVVAYVPQEHKPPFPYLVREVVLMGRTPHLRGVFGISRRDRMIAMDALETLGIAGLAERPYSQLSGGQRQMVLMARAIAQDTPLMFLDEPTSALDFQNQMRIWEIMRSIVENGRTIIACSHDPNHVAWFCDRVVVVGNNGVIADGDPVEAINEQTLGQIYRNTCAVQTVDGIRMVTPAGLQARKAGKTQANAHNQHACNRNVEKKTVRRIDYDVRYDKLEQ